MANIFSIAKLRGEKNSPQTTTATKNICLQLWNSVTHREQSGKKKSQNLYSKSLSTAFLKYKMLLACTVPPHWGVKMSLEICHIKFGYPWHNNLDTWKLWNILILFPHQELRGWYSRTSQYEVGNQNIVRCFPFLSTKCSLIPFQGLLIHSISALLIRGKHHPLQNTAKTKYQEMQA